MTTMVPDISDTTIISGLHTDGFLFDIREIPIQAKPRSSHVKRYHETELFGIIVTHSDQQETEQSMFSGYNEKYAAIITQKNIKFIL